MKIVWIWYLEFFSLLLSIVFIRGLKKWGLQSFVPLLLITCVTELLGTNRSYFGWKSNYFIYNYYLIVSYPLYMHIYLSMLNYSGLARKGFIGITIAITILFTLNNHYIQGPESFNTYSLILTEISCTLLSLLVILKLFEQDDFAIKLQSHPYFWISGSLLLYSVTMVVILGLQPFIQINKIQIDGKNIYRILSPIVNIILYGSFSYAFLLCNKLKNKL